MIFFVMILIFVSVFVLFYAAVPLFAGRAAVIGQKRSKTFASQMERVVMRSDIRKLSRLYVLAPILLGGAGFLLLPAEIKIIGLVLGVITGFVGPSIYIRYLVKKRKEKFNNQLIDALMIMSSSFRGGLSLIQAMEAVAEEMPEPISQEVGIVLNENKMGVALEEALNRLYRRMPSSALQQTITAIMLARETGGNLPVIFSRIVNTIRERNKIQQNIDTLTLQGKIQGVVMTLLPFAFGFIIYSTNRRFLDVMLNSPTGRGLLVYAVISECIGAYLIWKISTFKDF